MNYIDELIRRYPPLSAQRAVIERATECLLNSFRSDGKLLICGNGGSAADADHISGELLKGFVLERPIPAKLKEQLQAEHGQLGQRVAQGIQQGLPVINLNTHSALHSAFANDRDYAFVFAQMVMAYGREGDVLLSISTSGNSQNIIYATALASTLGLSTLALTGESGGKLQDTAGLTIRVPGRESYVVQEFHLPVYHAICLEVEQTLFGN